MAASTTSPRIIYETRKKLTAIHRMRKRKAELQEELTRVVNEINKTEMEIEEKEDQIRKAKQKAMQQVYTTRLEQQKSLKETKASVEGLQSKIAFLKKDTCDLIGGCMQEKVNIQVYKNLLDEKERKLQELKEELQTKRKSFEELEGEKAKMEIAFKKELEKARTDKLHRIERDNRAYEMSMKEQIEDYETKKKSIEKYLTEVNEERKCLQSTIELYAERSALLEEKKELLIKEYHCLLSSELEPNDDILKETMAGSERKGGQKTAEKEAPTKRLESDCEEQNEQGETLA